MAWTIERSPLVTDALPDACRGNACQVHSAQDQFNDVYVVHRNGGVDATLLVSQYLSDFNMDIWSEKVLPWLISLHKTCSGDCDVPHPDCPIWEAYA